MLKISTLIKYSMTLLTITCPLLSTAGILTKELCYAYRSFFDESLFSIAAAIGFGGILWTLAIDEGDNHLKTRSLKVCIGILGLVNLDKIISTLMGSSFVC